MVQDAEFSCRKIFSGCYHLSFSIKKPKNDQYYAKRQLTVMMYSV